MNFSDWRCQREPIASGANGRRDEIIENLKRRVMERITVTVQPYEYPSEPHRRRHGPAGYKDYSQYLPWLKDEFLSAAYIA